MVKDIIQKLPQTDEVSGTGNKKRIIQRLSMGGWSKNLG